MNEIFTDLFLIWISFTIFGLPALLYLAPSFLREDLFAWSVGLPMAGLVTGLVGATFFFGAGVPFSLLVPTLLAASLLAVAADLLRGTHSRLRELGRLCAAFRFDARELPFAFLFIASLALALWPCLIKGYSTTPYRFGPDGPLYAQAADYLTHTNPHGTLATAAEFSRLYVRRVGEAYPDLVGAAYVTHLRWGSPLLTALAGHLTQAVHPFAVMFLLSTFMLALCAALCRIMARKFFGLPSGAGWLCAASVMAHSSLLNTLLENQHPNIGFLCFVSMLVALVLDTRAHQEVSPGALAFGGLFFGATLSVYSESTPVLVTYFGTVFLLDLALRSWRDALATLKFLVGAFVLGLLFVAPYTQLVASHLFNLSTANVGYPQPRWAWPSEIVGLGNIFAGGVARWTSDAGSPITIHRSTKGLIGVALASLITLAAAIAGGRRLRSSVRNVWVATLAPILIVLTLSLLEPKHNYLYTKATVMQAPWLVVGFFAALWYALPRSKPNSARLTLLTVWALCTFGSGVGYLQDYLREYRVLTPEHLHLSDLGLADQHIAVLADDWGRRGGGHLRYIDRTSEFYELGFPSVQAIESNAFCVDPKVFKSIYDHRLYRFKRIEAGVTTEDMGSRTVFKGENFVLFETPYRLQDLVKRRLTCSGNLYNTTDQTTPSKSSSR